MLTYHSVASSLGRFLLAMKAMVAHGCWLASGRWRNKLLFPPLALPLARGDGWLMDEDKEILDLTWYKLGVREKRVVIRFVTRLLVGQNTFGYLTSKKKNWRKEAQEEALDASVYLCAELEDTDENC